MRTLILGFLILIVSCSHHQQPADEIAQLDTVMIDLDSKDTENNLLIRSTILSLVLGHASEIDTCYKNELKHKPNLEGTVITDFTFLPNGRLLKFGFKKNTLHDEPVESCIEHVFKTMEFPSSDHLNEVTYSLLFHSTPQEFPTL